VIDCRCYFGQWRGSWHEHSVRMPLDGVRYANSIGAGNDNTVAAIIKHGWHRYCKLPPLYRYLPKCSRLGPPLPPFTEHYGYLRYLQEINGVYKYLQEINGVYKYLQEINGEYKYLQVFTEVYGNLRTFNDFFSFLNFNFKTVTH
jgi:hypothetical protein